MSRSSRKWPSSTARCTSPVSRPRNSPSSSRILFGHPGPRRHRTRTALPPPDTRPAAPPEEPSRTNFSPTRASAADPRLRSVTGARSAPARTPPDASVIRSGRLLSNGNARTGRSRLLEPARVAVAAFGIRRSREVVARFVGFVGFAIRLVQHRALSSRHSDLLPLPSRR
jgi:hypothetical protein